MVKCHSCGKNIFGKVTWEWVDAVTKLPYHKKCLKKFNNMFDDAFGNKRY